MILLINFGDLGGQRANLGEITRQFRLKAEEQAEYSAQAAQTRCKG
jgi:hypothetical protein